MDSCASAFGVVLPLSSSHLARDGALPALLDLPLLIPACAGAGIGGVHRGGEATMDVSADLTELGRTPVAVVCAGVKSVLDIPRTLEYLETQARPASCSIPQFHDNSFSRTLFSEDCRLWTCSILSEFELVMCRSVKLSFNQTYNQCKFCNC